MSAAFLFEILCTIVRNGIEMRKSNTVRQCSATVLSDSVQRQCSETVLRDSAQRQCSETVLRNLEDSTPVVLKISFFCDATFCPTLLGFLFYPEGGSIVCVRNIEFRKVKNLKL